MTARGSRSGIFRSRQGAFGTGKPWFCRNRPCLRESKARFFETKAWFFFFKPTIANVYGAENGREGELSAKPVKRYEMNRLGSCA